MILSNESGLFDDKSLLYTDACLPLMLIYISASPNMLFTSIVTYYILLKLAAKNDLGVILKY
jgi:hypothetical protein